MNVKKGQEISREQFNRCMMRYCDSWRKNKETADDELLSSFRLFDKDNNGYIDPKELTRVLTGLGEKMKREEVQEMFKSADKNADGKIHYEEFVELFQNKHLEHVKKG
ncbi:CALM-like protein [Mya arenaria]|uniref:CALM-like protein n=2 Tax=Mya arenaria TaxID=6604 RepID=A0ABY7FBY0_MYAAR|nr:CALM-like protein [Mya arenaria]